MKHFIGIVAASLMLACGTPAVRLPDAGGGVGGGAFGSVGGGTATTGGGDATTGGGTATTGGGTATTGGGTATTGGGTATTGGGTATTGGGTATTGGGTATTGGGMAATGGGSAGGSTGPSATLTVSASPRRGPIAVDVALNGTDAGWTLQVRFDGGTNPASVMAGSARDGGFTALTWQSFDNIAVDAPVQLEVVSSGTVLGSATVNVRNDPAVDRLVAVGHPLLQLDGGGVTGLHNEVSVGVWDGTSLTDLRRLAVGRGPSALEAAPHGRATVVVNDRDGTFSILQTPLDANAANVTVLHQSITLPIGSVIDAHFSHDGRHLYVVGSAIQGTSDYLLWRFTPSEDLSVLGQARQVGELPGPSLRFGVDRESGRLGFPLGPGLQNRPDRVMVIDPADGFRSHVTPLTTGSAAGFAFSPRGGLLLVADDFSTPGLSLIATNTTTSTLVMRNTSIATPADVVFHPDSTAARGVALISQPFSDRVTPVVVTPNSLTVGTAVSNTPIGSASDIFERGPSKGIVFVACVTDVVRVTLTYSTGAAASRALVHDFGSAATDQVKGVAIQR